MKRKNKLFSTAAAVALLLCNGAYLNAQVTIGSDKAPEKFSVLEKSNNHNYLIIRVLCSLLFVFAPFLHHKIKKTANFASKI